MNEEYDEQIPKHSEQVDDEKYHEQQELSLMIWRKTQQDELSQISMVFIGHGGVLGEISIHGAMKRWLSLSNAESTNVMGRKK